jgi:hypothetical protein
MGEFSGSHYERHEHEEHKDLGNWSSGEIYTAVVIYSTRGGWNSMDNCSIRTSCQEHDGVAVCLPIRNIDKLSLSLGLPRLPRIWRLDWIELSQSKEIGSANRITSYI